MYFACSLCVRNKKQTVFILKTACFYFKNKNSFCENRNCFGENRNGLGENRKKFWLVWLVRARLHAVRRRRLQRLLLLLLLKDPHLAPRLASVFSWVRIC